MAKKKDAYYFSHDANARREDKCIALRGLYGWAGYGRFWALVEVLREQNGYRIDITTEFAMAKIAEELGLTTDEAKEFINVLIERFQLLCTDGKSIWSDSLNKRMILFEERRKQSTERGKKGAKKRWKKAGNSPTIKNDSPTIKNDSPTIKNDSKKRKGNKIKEKEENESEEEELSLPRAPKGVADVELFFTGLNVHDAKSHAEKFWNHYEAVGWMKGKVPIKNWKAAARSWIDKSNEFASNNTNTHNASGGKQSTAKQSLTQQRVEFDPGTIERDTAQALAELEASKNIDRSRGSP